VGQYSVALKLIELFGFIPTILVQSFAPAITKAKARAPELYHQRLLSFYRLVFLLFIVVSIPLFFTAEWIVVTLYGEPYRPAGILLSLFAIRLLFTNMGVAKSQFITNESLFKYSLMTAIVGALVNIMVNYFMIPLYGAKGAIIATIVSFTISIFILDVFFLRTRFNLKLMIKGMTSFWKIDRIK
ncbi:MAG: polysaccharide biosynthesis C-terminal domain-containing protein, partial [Bacteroidota bacterium]